MANPETEKIANTSIAFFLICAFVGLLVKATLKMLPRKRRPPYTVIVFVLGMIFGQLAGDTGAWGESIADARSTVPEVILFLLLPPLLFEAAYSVDIHVFNKVFGSAMLLAGPGVCISVALIAIFAKVGFDYGFSWTESLLLGAILSATDPVAVVASLKELGAPKRLATVIEAEALLNDGAAFVLFLIFKEYENQDSNPTAGEVVKRFFQLAIGGPAWGLATALVFWMWLIFTTTEVKAQVGVTITSMFACFFIAEHELHVSGVLAVVTFGLFVARKAKYALSPDSQRPLQGVLQQLTFYADSIIFFLSGILTVERVFRDNDIFQDITNWLQLLVLYVFIHLVRAFVLAIFYPILHRVGYEMTAKEAAMVVYGGLRGAVALVLLQLLEELQSGGHLQKRPGNLINFHVAGIVFLTLIINGTFASSVYKKLNVYEANTHRDKVFKTAMTLIEDHMARAVEELKEDSFYDNADWECVLQLVPNFNNFQMKKGRIKTDPNTQSVRTVFRAVRANSAILHARHHGVGSPLSPKASDDVSAVDLARATSAFDAEIEQAVPSDEVKLAVPKTTSSQGTLSSKAVSLEMQPTSSRRPLVQDDEDDDDNFSQGNKGSEEQKTRLDVQSDDQKTLTPSQQEIRRLHHASIDMDRDDEADKEMFRLEQERLRSVAEHHAALMRVASQTGYHDEEAITNSMLENTPVNPPSRHVKARRGHRRSQSEVMRLRGYVDKTEELGLLVFNTLKADFHVQFLRRHITDDGIVPLVEACDFGIEITNADRDDLTNTEDLAICLRRATKRLMQRLPLPLAPWVTRWLNSSVFTRVPEFVAFNAVVTSLEALGGYMRACDSVAMLLKLKHKEERLSQLVLKEKVKVLRLLEKWEAQFPSIARFVQTVLTARVLLRLKRDHVHTALVDGFLHSAAADVLTETLSRREWEIDLFQYSPATAHF